MAWLGRARAFASEVSEEATNKKLRARTFATQSGEADGSNKRPRLDKNDTAEYVDANAGADVVYKIGEDFGVARVGDHVAKVWSCDMDTGFPESFVREAAALRALRGVEFTVDAVCIEAARRYGMILMPAFTQTLSTFIGKDPVEPQACKEILFRVLRCLWEGRKRALYHRDVKSLNILLNLTADTACLADWGLVAHQTGALPNNYAVITLWYRPPELLLGAERYDIKADLWSCGVVLYEMLAGRHMFTDLSEIALLFGIFREFGTPNEQTWPGVSHLPHFSKQFPKFIANKQRLTSVRGEPMAIDLLRQLLVLDPSKRISLEDALSHNYFASLTWAVPLLLPSVQPSPVRRQYVENLASSIPPRCRLALKVEDSNARREFYDSRQVLLRNRSLNAADALLRFKVMMWIRKSGESAKWKTLFVCAMLLDCYMQHNVSLRVAKVEALAIGVLSLAVKLTENTALEQVPSDVDLIEEESKILTVLDFNLYRTTIFDLFGVCIQGNGQVPRYFVELLLLAKLGTEFDEFTDLEIVHSILALAIERKTTHPSLCPIKPKLRAFTDELSRGQTARAKLCHSFFPNRSYPLLAHAERVLEATA